MKSAEVAVVGAGIVGLAHAYMAARQGLRVVVFDREQFAIGASVRNFGLIWPIGQPPGADLERALRSRFLWEEVCREANIWMKANGSLHVAYHQDEWAVLQEFVAQYQNAYQVRLMDANEVVGLSPGVKREGLLGALHSSTEATVYSREAIRQIPAFLSEKFGVEFRMGQAVTAIEMPYVKTPRETWQIDQVFVCSGVDFETLYPSYFQQSHLTKCKLQMMRAVPRQPIELGPSLCAGLTLRHYEAFRNCPSLSQVAARYDAAAPQYKEHGVHVLVSQNAMGELIIGDSHHYGRTHEPFDSEYVNELITGYLSTFFHTASLNLVERWHGVYPKYSGGTHLVVHPEKGVTIVNGLGGAGMTLSFGLAEEIVGKG